jgi:hypothetical protein
MELDKLEGLLEKYFEATTTEAEEKYLKAYFSRENVAPHLEQYAPMFQYFSKAGEERFTKQVALPAEAPHSFRYLSGRGGTKRHLYKWVGVAATVVLMLGIYFGKTYQERKQAEYAYQETKKAFDLLAENFGRGTEKMAYLKEFEATKQKIYNHD